MMLVDKPCPETTSAPGPTSVERRQRTSARPWASSPPETALISYASRTGFQPNTGSIASSTAAKRASTGPLPIAALAWSASATESETMPVAFPPWDEVTFQPWSVTAWGDLGHPLLDERDQVV